MNEFLSKLILPREAFVPPRRWRSAHESLHDPTLLTASTRCVSITGKSIIMRLTSKGQVTIPLEIRERLGLLPLTEVEFDVIGDSVRIRKARSRQGRGQILVRRLRGSASKPGLTTSQIMAMTRGDD